MDRTAKLPPKRFGARAASAWHAVSAIAIIAGISACDSTDDSAKTTAQDRSKLTGEELFSLPFPGAGNERSCASCHVPEDNFTLTPEHVARLLEEDPNDPLFSAIDADDPTAEKLTFEHLKKGLVRVWLTLPDNVDLLDDAGEVITPSDRKLFVWRGVPSIADTALTAPFQRDGRIATLEEQAQGASTGHSEGGEVPPSELERIAEFERSVFSSDRARSVAEYLAGGGDPAKAPIVEDELELTEAEQRGRLLYEAVCANCHGGFNQAAIVGREIHDLAFPAIKPDGSVVYEVPATDPPTLVLASRPHNEFVNIGTAFEMYMALLGATEHESFTAEVGFPNYRYRFYTDGSRTEVAADLPPAASAFNPDAGGGFGIEVDGDGNPVVGPNFVPQFFSTDPGRSMITGSPNDFEAFDVPTLRGIAKTAPYFHNNTVVTLEEVVGLYSDHLLSRFPSLTQPGEKEVDPDGDIGVEETFTADQKRDLVAFLKRL
jgi:cytochrome c peroxidase